MDYPENLKYSKEHEWAKKENNVILVGITDFAQDQLGDVVFLELPELDTKLKFGEKFGEVESVKTVSELYSPVNGTVVEVNETLNDSPELVNESPYDKAWIIKAKPDEDDGMNELLSAEDYKNMCE